VALPGDDNRFRTGSYNGIENGALYITHIVQSDAGHYVCVGSNRLGDFTFDTTLNILGKQAKIILILLQMYDNNIEFATELQTARVVNFHLDLSKHSILQIQMKQTHWYRKECQ